MLRKLIALIAVILLSLSMAAPAAAQGGRAVQASAPVAVPAVAKPAPAQAQSTPSSLPASPVDQSKVPHYFGPYPNWANSPLTLPDATVTISPQAIPTVTEGNLLTARTYASDDAAAVPGAPGQGQVMVVLPAPLSAGTIQNFKTYVQNLPALGSPGNTFNAYVLRPTGVPNEYTVILDSGPQVVPAIADGVATYPVTPTPVLAGDVIAFYGQGIPLDITGSDLVAYPATAAPTGTFTFDAPGFPQILPRTYSFAATILPPGTAAGAGATAEATVGANGAVTAITVTNPGHDYANATVSITGAGTGATATATTQTSGVVTGITVGAGGGGYTAPQVTLTGGTTLIDATAHALGGVDAVSVTVPGVAYTFPTVDFDLPDDPAGLQAQGHAVCAAPYADCTGAVGNGLLDVVGVVVDSPGSGYATAPGLVIRDGTPFDPVTPPATFVSATAKSTINVLSVAIDTFGTGYTSSPLVTIADTAPGTGSGATATAATDYGAITAVTVTNAGSGYVTPGGIKKFVDGLPGLGDSVATTNNLGQYIPVAKADQVTFPNADYYVIAVVQHREQMSSSLPPTLLREYVQLETPANFATSKHIALMQDNLTGPPTPILMPDGSQAIGYDNPHYLGPTIVATKDRATRIVFYNLLPTGAAGDLFLPADTSLMGSGNTAGAMGPPFEDGTVMDEVRNPICSNKRVVGIDPTECYTENRATLHLHGGVTPWISDGTPHQWITPANETTGYPQGVAVGNVPDMAPVAGVPDCTAANDGCQTFYYTNQQSARLMFYHDHAWGITRLNVYAGEAAGYLVTDAAEGKLIGAGGPLASVGLGIPLVIQDRTFVPSPAQLAGQDPTWDASKWGGMGNLWYHHVYMPAQNPGDPGGMSAYGRWMYGPWFWPPATPEHGPIANPYFGKNPKGPDGIMGVPGSPEAADDFTTNLAVPCNLDVATTWQYDVDPFCEPQFIPGTPNISTGMEQFNDTPIVNGTAYPTTTVDPKAYRFRILNAANDRFWNLSWYVADNNGTPLDATDDILTEVAMNAAEMAAAQTDLNIVPTPDTTRSAPGPSWIQIGSEGGFLPAPTVVPAQPTTWITDPTRFDVGNVDKHSLLLAPAERADVVVDFSKYAGKTLILYNDAPAAFPARVPSYDYFTGGPDTGAGVVLPGYGPNTRTVMQVKIAATPADPAFNITPLVNAFKHHADGSGVFESSQDPIIVGQAGYNSAYGKTFAASGDCSNPAGTNKCDGMARINQQGGMDFRFDNLKASNPQLKVKIEPKAIHDEMNSASFDEFGRMTANLGLEAVPATPAGQNIMLYPYIAPPTEVIDGTNLPKADIKVQAISDGADGTQIWKITHNGVDTHPIHFHLFNVQVLNRVTWDNIIIPTEPSELGWKETVRISPLEDTIVAIRAITPVVPFEVPNSIRPLSPMMPLGANLDPLGLIVAPNGNVTTVLNALVNFGWEYVYHCHILSHEEMDMMRPVLYALPPLTADGLAFDRVTKTLSWNDNSITETSFEAQVSTDAGVTWTTFRTIQSPLNLPNVHEPRSTTYPSYSSLATYQFRVVAKNMVGAANAATTGFSARTVQSVSAPLTVGLLTTTTLTSTPNPSIFGDLVTFTATVAPPAATGTVSFSEGATVLGTSPLAGGVATFAISTLAVGTHPIIATYNGDATYSNSVSAVVNQVVNVATSTTTLASDVNPSLAGALVTFTATVLPAGATGSVEFFDGATSLAVVPLAAGLAVYPTAALAVGSHTMTAVYSGDLTYSTSTSNIVTQVVGLVPSTITLATDGSPSLAGALVTFTATVGPAGATGSVEFFDGATSLAVVPLAAGLAVYPTAALAVGSHTMTAVYSGDLTYSTNTSNIVTQVVGLVTTTTSLVSDTNPSVFGGLVTFTATVAPAAATGTVEFRDGATVLGTGTLTGGVATYATSTLAVGAHSITAVYSGDVNNATSTSNTVIQDVGQVSTTTTLVSDINPSVFGQNVTFSATLSTSFATGTVTFLDGTTSLGTAPVVTGGATFSTTSLAVGTHAITAVYNGDATYAASTSNAVSQVVNLVSTTTTLASSLNPSVLGQSVTFTATLSASAATGTVTFTVDGTPGAPVAVAAGQAAFSTATLAVGAHSVVAAYSGDGSYAASTSSTLTQTVDPLPAPSGLVALAISSTQINITWVDNAPSETGFTVQRATNSAFTTGLNTITLNGANQTVYTNPGRTPNTTYFYRVQAFNALGVSAWSNTASAFTAVAGAPAAPSVLGATAISKAQINLAWTDNATNETGFTVQRSANVDFVGSTTITLNTVNLATYSDVGRAPNTTYFYRVRAFNAVGTSAWSNTASATTFPLVPPLAPSGLTASAVTPNQINLAWTDNATNETGFTIQRASTSAFTGVVTITLNAVDQVAYNNTGRVPNTTYWYRVRAFNADGFSAWSNAVFATTPPSIPAVPAGVSVTPAGAGTLFVAWTYASNGALGPITYTVQRSNNGTTAWTTVGTGLTTTSFSNAGLPAGATRFYRVRSVNATGTSAYTAAVSGIVP